MGHPLTGVFSVWGASVPLITWRKKVEAKPLATCTPPYSPHHTPRLCPTEVPAATLPWAHSLCLFPPPSALLSSFCPCPVIFSLGSLVQDFLPLPSSLGPVLRRCLQPTPPKPLTQPFHQVWLPSHTLISACHPILGAYFSGFLIYHLCLSQLLPGPSGSFSSP